MGQWGVVCSFLMRCRWLLPRALPPASHRLTGTDKELSTRGMRFWNTNSFPKLARARSTSSAAEGWIFAARHGIRYGGWYWGQRKAQGDRVRECDYNPWTCSIQGFCKARLDRSDDPREGVVPEVRGLIRS